MNARQRSRTARERLLVVLEQADRAPEQVLEVDRAGLRLALLVLAEDAVREVGRDRRLVVAERRRGTSAASAARFFAHSISVARSPAGRNLYGAGRPLPIRRRSSAFVERMRPGIASKRRSSASAAEWNVEARTPSTPSAASRPRAQLAGGLVRERHRDDLVGGANAPLATCQAIRRVIVVVLPVPAPARMQTGPRVASAAARCSAFSPPRMRSAVTSGPP